MITIIYLIFTLYLSQSNAITNKIIKAKSINTSETIVSLNGKFELGFFQPCKNDRYYFVGIWYKNIINVSEIDKVNGKVNDLNCVWVANRDYPALTPSATLTVHSDGNIVISDGKMIYMVTNVTSSPSNSNNNDYHNNYAMVLDSGNFVLRDEKERDLWQSFDYPSNTLLPGMKISGDTRLISWKSQDDPSPGRFSLTLDSVNKKLNEMLFSGGNLSENSRIVLTDLGELKRVSWSETKECWESDGKCEEKKQKRGITGSKRNVYIVTFVTIFVAILLLAGFVYLRIRNLRGKGENLLLFDVEMSLKHNLQELPEVNNNNHKRKKGRKKHNKLLFFSFSSVSKATENFSDTNKVGEGGFGPVYKGTLMKGDEVAVKRLSSKSRQGKEQFKNEAHLVARLQHKNLVRLLGCCIERKEQILIYEYMPNKSLDFFLYDSTRRKHLKWPVRANIIKGIAHGLLYLHKYSRIMIVHRDIKPGNILLDIDMNPRISDFGMARIFSGSEFPESTARPAGTIGYMSPESGQRGIFSEKSDVFSFGVLFLEILSGKKHTEVHNAETRGLIAYAWELWRSDRTMDLLDPLIENDPTAIHNVLRYVRIALLCVQEIAAERPNMSQVLSMLCNSSEVLPYPNQPAFLDSTSFARSRSMGPRDTNATETRPELVSVNELSFSVLEPR